MNLQIQLVDVTLGHDGPPLFRDLQLLLPGGKVTALIGPNGCGKSTLLRALARQHRLRRGRVLIGGDEVGRIPAPQLARTVALLPQHPVAPADLTVRELVAFGRFPHRRWLAGPDAEDRAAIDAAIATVGLDELAARPLTTLSGGQRQRAWIAMTLAQRTTVLLLDEPTAALDLAHQVEVLATLRQLRDRGLTVVVAVHDLNLAARWADHVVVLHEGAVFGAGSPAEVLDEDVLAVVYGVEARRLFDPVDAVPVFSTHGLAGVTASGDTAEGSR